MWYNPNKETDYKGTPVVKYTGCWRKGKRHGFGVLKDTSGRQYAGKWRKNAPHGHLNVVLEPDCGIIRYNFLMMRLSQVMSCAPCGKMAKYDTAAKWSTGNGTDP